jgi:hypothetical protein
MLNFFKSETSTPFFVILTCTALLAAFASHNEVPKTNLNLIQKKKKPASNAGFLNIILS